MGPFGRINGNRVAGGKGLVECLVETVFSRFSGMASSAWGIEQSG
jgi:hypothetical protein